ncbi:MAG: hypothetical protein WAV18_19205 [Roseiarcus sp.]
MIETLAFWRIQPGQHHLTWGRTVGEKIEIVAETRRVMASGLDDIHAALLETRAGQEQALEQAEPGNAEGWKKSNLVEEG